MDRAATASIVSFDLSPPPAGRTCPAREEVMLIEVSFALKLLDVNDQMCAGGAAIIADRQDLTSGICKAADAQNRRTGQ